MYPIQSHYWSSFIYIYMVFFDLRKSAKLNFLPTKNPLYYTSDLLSRGFTAAKWTCGRSAQPPSLSAAALGPENVLTEPNSQIMQK